MSNQTYHQLISISLNPETNELLPVIYYNSANDLMAVRASIEWHGGGDQFRERAIELAERAIDCVCRHVEREA